ncbi:MAG: glycosyltransferase [Selenomonadaceae bacterium]|nr:glycosyltransferase [Selenomonadaceae bacterium]
MKVSVIIPMYNAEKYLSVCLESILIQTMQDFEVIIVDDCSTDNSVAIAKSYAPKFGGRLKLFSLSENTGTPGLPRNVGLEYACGKYIYFADSDDLIVDNALEKLFNYAEEYQADVVYTDAGFTCGAEPVPENLQFISYKSEGDMPTFETENLAERIEKFLRFEFEWVTWLKFSRRDFLVDNNINFPAAKTSEDGIWTFKILCTAKKFLRVHEPFYIQRFNKNSITRSNRSLEDWIILHTSSLINNIEALDEFMNRHEFFKKNPEIRLKMLDYFISVALRQISLVKNKLTSAELYEIFLREVSKISSPALTAYLFLIAKSYRDEMTE